jgi:hemerythrin-like domain-containing protein
MDEHRLFQNGFDEIFRRAKNTAEPEARKEILRALFSFCRVFFEEFHHGKEEELLFPALATKPGVHAGGPECVLHYDQQMRSPPLEAARRVCAEVGVKAIELPWAPDLQNLRATQSPLTIPLEDHEAGRILLRAIEFCLEQDETGAGEKTLRLFESYRDLQERHIRKENGCLFCMSRSLIDPGHWSELEKREPKWTAAGLHPLVAALIPT